MILRRQYNTQIPAEYYTATVVDCGEDSNHSKIYRGKR